MPRKTTVESRIIRFTKKDEKSGCLVWSGCVDKDGYGKVRVNLNGKLVFLAHRMAYIHFVGEIPDGMELDHKCRNRSCVNHEHLEPVTHIENVNRGVYPRETHANYRKTHCKNGHEFTDINTRIEVWNGIRMRKCRICDKAKNERSNLKRKLKKMSNEIVEV